MGMFNVLGQVNYLAVLVAGACHMVVSLAWFHARLFGREWERLTGQELKPAPPWIGPGIVGHMLIALALAALIKVSGAGSIGDALLVAVFVWVGFVVTLETGELLWEKIPVKLFLIRIGNHLVALCVTSLVLAVWK